jgi:hypothetical protein
VSGLVGVRAPRLRTVPPYERTYGPEVAELAAVAGLHLDPWQRDVLDDLCAESRPGKWNTLECAVVVPRQNGKGGFLEAYVLGCLFLFDDPLVMYSAHRFDTAREMFLRIKDLITGSDDLSRRVLRVSEAHGKEGIELRSGQRLRFYARSEKAGRGFSGDKNILDEAFKLDAGMMSAIMPTMSARKNPQIVYASSAGWEISEQLGKLRRRALTAITSGVPDASLSFAEWSAPDDMKRDKATMADRALWAQANPAMGIRISEEFVAAELRTMGAIEFARERLGVSDYPLDPDEDGWSVIRREQWEKLADTAVTPADRVGSVALSAETTQDRSMSAIAIAFRTADGMRHLEVVEFKAGATWVVPRVMELLGKYEVCALVIDKVGAASSFVDDLEALEVEVLQPTAAEVTDAYGQFYDACVPGDGEDGEPLEPTVRHLDQDTLNAAVAGALTRRIGDREALDRKAGPHTPPLMAAEFALWGLVQRGDDEYDVLDSVL